MPGLLDCPACLRRSEARLRAGRSSRAMTEGTVIPEQASLLIGADELGELGAGGLEQDQRGAVLRKALGGLERGEKGRLGDEKPRAALPCRGYGADLDVVARDGIAAEELVAAAVPGDPSVGIKLDDHGARGGGGRRARGARGAPPPPRDRPP